MAESGPEQTRPTPRLATLERMLLIRRTEEALIHLHDDEHLIRGHYHVSIGQEATAVAVCAELRAGEHLFTTHRNHGHLLARGGQPEPLVAEILGRRSGYSGGRGGSFHPVIPALGIVHTSAIVGGSLALAAGAALSELRLGTGRAAVAFFGDGVLEEGVFAETVNMASLWRLPLLMLCENNTRAAEGGPRASDSLAARELADLPRALGVPCDRVDGADPEAVAAVVGARLRAARSGAGPAFVETRTVRWPGNMGSYPALPGSDTSLSWAWEPEAAPAAVREWVTRHDPVVRAARGLLDDGLASRADLLEMERRMARTVADAVAAARAAPLPDPDDALAHVFTGGR